MSIVVTIPRPQITTLVLRGDGIKGVGYVGALEVLNEKNLIQKLTTVAGSSAGAITAMFLALGYSQKEIENELTSMDFSKFKDYPNTFFNRITQGFFSGLYGLFGYNHGFYQGKLLHQWLEEKVEKKLRIKNATFQDLQNAIRENKSDNGFKELIVTGTNLQTEKTCFFSAESTPNLAIADAVRISSSIPGFFETVYINSKTGKADYQMNREKAKDPAYAPYVDGGLLDNFPIEYFSDGRYSSSYGINNGINPSVLGLRIDSAFESAAIWNTLPKKLKGWSIWRWLQAIVSSPIEDTNKLNKYGFQVISSDDLNISATDFALSEKGKQGLIQKAKEATAAYFENYIEEAAYEVFTFKTKEEFDYHYEWYKNQLQHYEGLKKFGPIKSDIERKINYLKDVLIPAFDKKAEALMKVENEINPVWPKNITNCLETRLCFFPASPSQTDVPVRASFCKVSSNNLN
ncbi:patatin-like phospholipase family protein [Legionella feeleii]|uniref:Patatin-like phospholipase n=1 Tax=Legionella feeleii TaxID=453 RepID=A0A378KKV2_9GAMM|nr:patatin-like phospholipase family protein [Legionella feeleii]STX88259.1 patatin-like phospholipase [Legionella feeleii]